MPSIKIEIVNPLPDLTVQYNVEYKRADEVEYQTLYPYITGGSFVVIPNLMAGNTYHIRIQRLAKDGSVSNWTLINHTIYA